jgi:hypothetical protein
MKIKYLYAVTTLTIWERSLQGNWRIYLSAPPRCSSLNRVAIPLRRALMARQINAPLTLSNYGF